MTNRIVLRHVPRALRLTSFHLVLVYVLLLTPHPSLADDSTNQFATVADVLPCNHPVAVVASYAVVLSVQSTRSLLECLGTCYRTDTCTNVMHMRTAYPRDLCVMLGALSRSPVSLNNVNYTSCKMLLMNPCKNGGFFNRGFCHCPENFAGMSCELNNPEKCYSSWTEVMSSDVYGVIVNGNTSFLAGKTEVKVKQVTNATISVEHCMSTSKNASGVFVCQLYPTLTTQSWDRFQNVSVRRFRIARADKYASVQTFTAINATVNTTTAATSWYVRQVDVSRFLYSYSITGAAVQGSLDNVFDELEAGSEVVNARVVYFDRLARKVVVNKFEKLFALTLDLSTLMAPPYWYNYKYSTTGEQEILRYFVVTDAIKSNTSEPEAHSISMDECWVNAMSDRVGNNKTIGHLLGAIINGYRTRVVVNTFSMRVDQVVIADDLIAFFTSAFLEPVNNGSFSSASKSVRLVAVSDGRVYACRSELSGALFDRILYNGSVTWFVDSRPWSRVYTVTTEGASLYGSEAKLCDALKYGASLQLGIKFPYGNHYLLLTVYNALLTSDGSHVVAQVEGLLSIIVNNGRIVSNLDCDLWALLVTSQGSVEIYKYRNKVAGNYTLALNLTIDWFVEGV